MTLANLDLYLVGLALFATAAVGVWRIATGPTTLDRMVGFESVAITASGLVLVFSAATASNDFIEFVFILAALGFLTTVAYFYYLMQLSKDDPNFDPESRP